MKHRTGHLFKRGKAFYVSWRQNGKTATKALRDAEGQPITTRREAQEARAKWMAQFAIASDVEALEVLNSRLAGRKADLARLEDAQNPPLHLDRTWAAYVASPNRPDTGADTLAVYEGQFGQFVTWMEANHADVKALADVGPDLAAEYASHLNLERLAPGTYNKHVRVLELVFRVLMRSARMERNPWGEISRKKLEVCSRRELTTVELRKVCQNADGEMRSLLAIGVYTGMRLKDCAGLRWAETDLVRGIITRVPSKTARRTGKPVIIPIHPALREILTTASKEDPDYVLPAMARDYLAGGTGKRRIIDSIQDHFASQGVRIHKPGTGPGTGKRAVLEVGFHSLRHSFVSLCREAGTSQAVVQSIVGHSSPSMLAHYTHVGLGAATTAIAALPSVLEPLKPLAPKPPMEAILERIRIIARQMSADNWQTFRAELLEL